MKKKTEMLIPVSLILLFSLVSFGTCCCEKKERISAYLDAAADLISKAKSENISCDKEQNTSINVLDCADLHKRGYNESGLYTIWPISRLTSITRLDVFCDMTTDGGGWTRRGDFQRENDYFNKDWESYKKGFGKLDKDFWFGNDNIFAITNQKLYSIRFDFEDKQLNKRYATYDTFWIDDEFNNYPLHISGYRGTGGNAMSYDDKMKFSTRDRDNDLSSGNCATSFKSGWWFKDCYHPNLNGLYNDETSFGIRWSNWKKEPLLRSEIKIRPMNF